MSNKGKPASTTASAVVTVLGEYMKAKGLVQSFAVLEKNQRPILGDFSEEETVALGQLLDRLEGLERATRIKLNPRALERMREDVEAMLAMDGDPADRIAAHGFSVLLEMYDRIQGVPK